MLLNSLLTLPLLLGAVAATQLATAPPKKTITAFGFGVSNYTRSLDYYTRLVGMTNSGVEMPTEIFDEIVLTHGSGSAFLLMQFKDQPARPTHRLPVKIVFGVPDVISKVKEIAAEGYKVVIDPETIFGFVGIVEDPDGNLVEFNPAD